VADPTPEPVAVNVTVRSTPKSAEFVVKTEVVTPLLFVLGDELLKLAVTSLLFVEGVSRVRVSPETASPFKSVTVKVIVVVSLTTVLPSATFSVPEIAMLPSPNVTVVLADSEPKVARTVATPEELLDNVTDASPPEFTSAVEALKVPREVVNVIEFAGKAVAFEVKVAVITEKSLPSAATEVGLADMDKV